MPDALEAITPQRKAQHLQRRRGEEHVPWRITLCPKGGNEATPDPGVGHRELVAHSKDAGKEHCQKERGGAVPGHSAAHRQEKNTPWHKTAYRIHSKKELQRERKGGKSKNGTVSIHEAGTTPERHWNPEKLKATEGRGIGGCEKNVEGSDVKRRL